MSSLETTLLALGGAACALYVVLERAEERQRLYALPAPGVEDLEPARRRLALDAFGAAQALLNAIAVASASVKEAFSPVAAQARRLAFLHLELVRAGASGPQLWSIPCALEYARTAVKDESSTGAPSGEKVAAELQAEIEKATLLLEGGES